MRLAVTNLDGERPAHGGEVRRVAEAPPQRDERDAAAVAAGGGGIGPPREARAAGHEQNLALAYTLHYMT